MTAAHCLVVKGTNTPKNRDEVQIHAGVTNQTEFWNGQRKNVDNIIIHPSYQDGSPDHDIALIHLSTPLDFNSKVQPIAYATPYNTFESDIARGKPIDLMGYGATEIADEAPPSPILQKARVTIEEPYDGTHIRLPSHPRSASGDSGSPGVIRNAQQIPIAAGICSHTRTKTRWILTWRWKWTWKFWKLLKFLKKKKTTVYLYTRVKDYASWIRSQSGVVPRLITISGSDPICSSSSRSYSVSNLPSTLRSVSIRWYSSNPSALYINPYSGVARRLSGSFNGQVTITARIEGYGGSSYAVMPQKKVQVAGPIRISPADLRSG